MSAVTATTSDDVRRLNLGRVLRQVHTHGQVTRSDLVAATGLNRSTVAGLVNELSAEGLVAEVAGHGGTVGRPSLMVAPVRDSAFVLAFDLRVERIIAAVMGLGGELLYRVEQSHRRSRLTPASAARELGDLAEKLLAELPEGCAWVGTGIALPGVVDPRAGVVRFAPNLGWTDVDFAALVVAEFTERFHGAPPVNVDNDANLGALAEHIRGAGTNVHNLVYISGDVGIGSGVIMEGALLTGSAGYAGEVGHMVVNPQGRECRCGARGCWETEIGSQALLRGAGEKFEHVTEVVHAAATGDEEATLAVKSVSDWLAVGVGNLANAFNPEVIIMGGHLRYVAQFTDAAAGSQLQSRWGDAQHGVQLALPALGEDSSLIGAGEAAFAALLNDPLAHLLESHRLVVA